MQTLLSNGFNVVVGNPPYIQLNKGILAKMYKNSQYTVFDKIGNLYCLFYIRGIELLKEGGYLAYITSNYWMKAINYGRKLREYLSQYNVIELIDLGGGVFEDAKVDTNILLIQKNSIISSTLCYDYKHGEYKYLDNNIPFTYIDFPKDGSIWLIESETDIKKTIKEKIISKGKQIKDRNDIKILFGVKTGHIDAFVINKLKRDEILTNCKTEEERERTKELLRPVLRGKDVKNYSIEYKDLYLINTHNGVKKINLERVKIENYPAIKKHLDNYYEKLVK